MGERDIDKHFRDELKGYSKEVDTDAIWSALDLGEEKKKRPILIWALGILFVLISTFSYFVIDTSIIDQKIERTTTETVAIEKEGSELVFDAVNTINDSFKKRKENSIASNSIIDKNTVENRVQITDQKSNDIAQNKSIGISINAKNLNVINSNIINFPSTVEVKESTLSFIEKKSRSTLSDIKSDNSELRNISSIGSNHLLNSITPTEILAHNTLDSKNAQPFSIIERATPGSNLVKIYLHNISSSGGLSLNVYSGIYNINRTLSAQNVALEEFLAIREEVETPLELVSVGAQLRYDIGSVYFKGGIEYQSLNERFELEQYDVLDTVPAPGVVGILIDSDGNALNQMGTVYEENTLTTNWTYYNSHRLFNIPLGIGYEKGLENWFFFIEAQSQLNFHHSFSGKRLDQEGNVTDGNSDIDRSFKLGLGAAVGVRYKIADNTSIYCSPNYFSYLDSFADSSKGIAEKYSIYGIQVGLSYKLF